MTGYKFVRQEDIDEYRRFCLHHARAFGRPLPDELWHYTDANGLIGILESGKIWATQVSCLNDTLEQRYFGELIHRAVKECRKQNADHQLEVLFRVADDVLDNIDFTADGQFVACFSEAEDDLGQWRGYGGGECGYAIGFRANDIIDIVNARSLTFLLPMGYTDDVHNFIVADVIKSAEIYFKQGLERGLPDSEAWATEFIDAFGEQLSIIAAMVKHPKFSGEAERRISARLQPGEHSELLFRQKRTLLARHLPIRLNSESVPRMPITRIYIGPGPSQKVSKISVGDLLLKHGYGGLSVEISKIPYRLP